MPLILRQPLSESHPPTHPSTHVPTHSADPPTESSPYQFANPFADWPTAAPACMAAMRPVEAQDKLACIPNAQKILVEAWFQMEQWSVAIACRLSLMSHGVRTAPPVSRATRRYRCDPSMRTPECRLVFVFY